MSSNYFKRTAAAAASVYAAIPDKLIRSVGD